MHQPPDDPFGWPPAEKPGEPTAGSEPPRAEPAHDPFMRPVPPGQALSAQPPGVAPIPVTRQLPAGRRVDLIGVVNRVLDTLDTVGDRIAAIAGIGPRNR